MALVDINWNPSRKELRVFALLQVVFFAVVSWWLIHHRFGWSSLAVVVASVSTVLAVVGSIWPSCLRMFYVVWMAAVFPIGWTVSHVLMAGIFYLVITPIGWIMRLVGRDPLERKFDPQMSSYWKPRENNRNVDRYFRQY